jgi:hypothetical protein
MSCKYVKEFDFGAPKVQVKAYARGGPVKKVAPAPLPAKTGPVGPRLAPKKPGCGC